MAKTAAYVQRGEALDYKNGTEEMIPAGTVVLVGKRIGVAGSEIPAGAVGTIHVTGVFEIPKKASVELKAGDNIVFTDADGIDKATSDVMGYAVEDAAAAAATAKVKLLG